MLRHSSILKVLPLVPMLSLSLPALAQSFYVSGSVGKNYQDDTSNNGTFTSNFTTGAVTGVTPPLDIAAGSPVSWHTNYDNGDAYSIAFGMKLENYRFELEYAMSDADVDNHQNVNAAGIDLSGIDAGVLISGNVGDLGVTTANLVADGRGDFETETLMLNAYYDFVTDSAFTPYVGVGIGTANTEIEFRPSAVGVLSDDDDGFVYQFILGISYDINDAFSAYGSYTFRDADEASLDARLLPANFDINNESNVLNVGLRYSF
ncbi:MAG: outer membrane beta-barrel protein [Pseudohongiellaceae bacterium]|jgi:opacity protein-like surface antigen